MSKILDFFLYSFLYLIALFFGGFFRLHLMTKMKIRNIIFIQSLLFIIGEVGLALHFFVTN